MQATGENAKAQAAGLHVSKQEITLWKITDSLTPHQAFGGGFGCGFGNGAGIFDDLTGAGFKTTCFGGGNLDKGDLDEEDLTGAGFASSFFGACWAEGECAGLFLGGGFGDGCGNGFGKGFGSGFGKGLE